MAYDQSVGPREGVSAISPQTRQRLWGTGQPQQFNAGSGVGAGAGASMGVGAGDQLLSKLYGGGNDEMTQLLQSLLSQWQPQQQETPSQYAITKKMVQDPVGWANKMRDSQQFYQWDNPNGVFYDRVHPTSEATLASQGNNATNQWAQLGGMKGVDPNKLRDLNMQTAGYRTYF